MVREVLQFSLSIYEYWELGYYVLKIEMDPQTRTIMFIKCAIGVMIASVILSSHPQGVRYATMFKVVVVKTMPPPNTKNVGAPLYRQSSSELYCKPTFGHEIRSK